MRTWSFHAGRMTGCVRLPAAAVVAAYIVAMGTDIYTVVLVAVSADTAVVDIASAAFAAVVQMSCT